MGDHCVVITLFSQLLTMPQHPPTALSQVNTQPALGKNLFLDHGNLDIHYVMVNNSYIDYTELSSFFLIMIRIIVCSCIYLSNVVLQTQFIGSQRKGLKMTKIPFTAWAISFWYVKINPSQNQGLSTSSERPYKKLLNALFNFQMRHSELKLWAIKKASK